MSVSSMRSLGKVKLDPRFDLDEAVVTEIKTEQAYPEYVCSYCG